MTTWLLDEAPNLSCQNSDTANEYKKQLNYCKEIDLNVINNYPRDINRNNPSSTLQRIMRLLENYHDKLHALNCARGFNHLITEIENELLGLASRSLDILYLLIDPELPSGIPFISNFANKIFMVDKFVNPGTTDEKLIALRNTQLGEWLYQTLDVAGVTYSKFEPGKPILIKENQKHLRGELPVDGPCFKPSTKRSGLREFDSVNINKRDDYLFKIRKLHRLTLELYHFGQSLIKGSKASTNFGDTWMYGHPGGKVTLAELLDHIHEVTNNYTDTFDDFWNEYYSKDFLPLSKEKYLNRNDEKNGELTHIEVTIKPELIAIKEKIDALIKNIKIKSTEYSNNLGKIEQSKVEFMLGVLECREFYKKTNTDNYRRLKIELNKLQNRSDDIPYDNSNHVTAQKSRASIIPQNNRLATALDCLTIRTKKECKYTEKYRVVPNIAERRFYSDIQRKGFNTIIKKYNGVVNNDLLSGSILYNAQQFEEIRYRYMCLFDAYVALYTTDLTDTSDVDIVNFKEENKDAIGIFDLELTRFMLRLDLQYLLFKRDSLTALPEVLTGKQDAIQIERHPDGSYVVEQNSRYEKLESKTVLKSVREIREEYSIINQQLEAHYEDQKRQQEQFHHYSTNEIRPEAFVPTTNDEAPTIQENINCDAATVDQKNGQSKSLWKTAQKKLSLFSFGTKKASVSTNLTDNLPAL